jgi:hypothetical protein
MLLMLEDDSERLARFAATLRAIDPELPLQSWRDSHVMIREVGPLLKSAKLISLDHDLEPEPGAADPGDGLAVAKFLVSQPVICPVIVHSSNSERSRWMAGEFDLAGWPHCRVAPFGDDWIETDWRAIVIELLDTPRRRPRS